MSIFISIVGLGLLILIHEAGHFFVARAVGMNPRKFYIGFPPALAKTTRNGIEYGIGTIPLGGYVKIPGMHRPAAGDLDVHFGRAVSEQPSLGPGVEELRRRLAVEDHEHSREAVARLEAELERAELSPLARKAADRGVDDVGDALGPDAYWRARTWKRVAVIFAGPGANLLLAIVLFTALFMAGGGRATQTVDEIVPELARRERRAAGRGPDRRDRGPGDRLAGGHPRADLRLGRPGADGDRGSRRRVGRARSRSSRADRRRLPARLCPAGRGSRPGRVGLAGDPT